MVSEIGGLRWTFHFVPRVLNCLHSLVCSTIISTTCCCDISQRYVYTARLLITLRLPLRMLRTECEVSVKTTLICRRSMCSRVFPFTLSKVFQNPVFRYLKEPCSSLVHSRTEVALPVTSSSIYDRCSVHTFSSN